ncbi:Hypothetical predicted protein [Xyrichtys novacula]|uniref:Uncharacterized protein n=1 Tax=Xyrichtys novacula TaxID=13765 RepID=A0AAV1G0T7_XYRNO|nr:Hypothetical predicted protein [Xyrichtys novacula]
MSVSNNHSEPSRVPTNQLQLTLFMEEYPISGPGPAWVGLVKMTAAAMVSCQTHWSGPPQSHDLGRSCDPEGAANSVAFSCGGKTFQQLASDGSRNICNVRHW